MDEMLTISSNPAKMKHFQESGLKFDDFAQHLNKKEEKEEIPTDDQIQNLFNPVEEQLDFTSEFNDIFEENKKKKLSQESDDSEEIHSPFKKSKTEEIIMSQPDPFASQSSKFSASTQMELEKIFKKDIPLKEYRPSPWKSDKIKTTVNKTKNLNRRKIDADIEEDAPISSKETIANEFSKAFGSKKSSSELPTVASTSTFSNPWSRRTQVEKKEEISSFKQQPSKPAMFSNPWSKKPQQNEKKEKSNFSIGKDPFVMSKKSIFLPSQKPSIQNNPYDLVKKPEVCKENPPPPVDIEKKDPFSSYSTARQQLAWLNNDKANSRVGLSKKSSLSQQPLSTTSNDQDENPLRKKFCVPLKENVEKNVPSPDDNDDLNHPSLKGKKILFKNLIKLK